MPAATADLSTRVAAACRRLRLVGERVLVAVSAGADSTALACLLHEVLRDGSAASLVLGHVDHGWRGAEEAAADRAVLEGLAARLDVPLLVSPPPPAGTPRSEDAARRWRYRSLARMAHEAGCAIVATGHHAGDQAETFLMRLLRGSGLTGLSGIPAERSLHPGPLRVVRPVLEEDPAALRTWLVEHDVPWRDDPTNRDPSRERAAIRARLAERSAEGHAHVPTLSALAARLARRLAERTRAIEARAAHAFRLHRLAGAVEMPRDLLQPLHGEDLALALRLAGRRLQAEAEGPWFVRRHVVCFERLLDAGGQLDLPRGLFLHVSGKTAWLAWREAPEEALPRLDVEVVAREAFDLDAFAADHDAGCAALDADVLASSPRLRLLEAGDRFVPHASGPRRATSVKGWLSKRGVPGLVRRGQLVLAGARGVAWVVGRRVDAAHAVGARTRRVALVRVLEA